jgi:ELWxxDGT repeat protein
MKHSTLVLFACLSLICLAAEAEDFFPLVSGPTTTFIQSSNPGNFVQVNGRTIFFATKWTIGTELWSTDGTPEGTVLLKDIYPGTFSGVPNGTTDIAVLNGFAYVVTMNSEGYFLCKTDGTPANTTLIPLPC